MTKEEILLSLHMDPNVVRVKNTYFNAGVMEGYPIFEMEDGTVKFPLDVSMGSTTLPNIMWMTIDEWNKNFEEATKGLDPEEKEEILNRIKSRNQQ